MLNSALTNLDGLSRITTVGGYIEVVGARLQRFTSGLSGDVHGAICLQNSHSALTNVDGLSSLTTVGGYLLVV